MSSALLGAEAECHLSGGGILGTVSILMERVIKKTFGWKVFFFFPHFLAWLVAALLIEPSLKKELAFTFRDRTRKNRFFSPRDLQTHKCLFRDRIEGHTGKWVQPWESPGLASL